MGTQIANLPAEEIFFKNTVAKVRYMSVFTGIKDDEISYLARWFSALRSVTMAEAMAIPTRLDEIQLLAAAAELNANQPISIRAEATANHHLFLWGFGDLAKEVDASSPRIVAISKLYFASALSRQSQEALLLKRLAQNSLSWIQLLQLAKMQYQ